MLKYILIFICCVITSVGAKAQSDEDANRQDFVDAYNKFVATQRYVEKPAEFKEGTPALYDWIQSHIVYPDEALAEKLSAQVFVNFVIDFKTGLPKNIKIIQSSNKIFNKETIRLIKSMPPWNPATKNGYAQGMLVSIPIYFHLN